MTETPGTDRDEARENVRDETPLVPEDVEGAGDDVRPQGDEGVTGDDAKPSAGDTELGT
ncbi:hypothetical protein [Blastococcus saxobsidens]|uniref:Uncharacterized protein n=1 Tax=Blastococcus saxobsidens TaxID=138336 RepID=A0A4Q7Y9T4_9ACTN|nr:hypothetical protein [Blastococcus saxobsidens]RZU33912.1 hypothetical protein BKA19_3653 [Blastococcus saxobsidens]